MYGRTRRMTVSGRSVGTRSWRAPSRAVMPPPIETGLAANAAAFRVRAERRRHRPLVRFSATLSRKPVGGQPALVGADQEREVLGHVAGFDGVDADLLQRLGELRELGVVVELGAVGEAAGPGEDRGDRVGRGLLALLVLAVVAGHRAVGGLGLHGLAVRASSAPRSSGRASRSPAPRCRTARRRRSSCRPRRSRRTTSAPRRPCRRSGGARR